MRVEAGECGGPGGKLVVSDVVKLLPEANFSCYADKEVLFFFFFIKPTAMKFIFSPHSLISVFHIQRRYRAYSHGTLLIARRTKPVDL